MGNTLDDQSIRKLREMNRKLAGFPMTPLAPQLRMKTREIPGKVVAFIKLTGSATGRGIYTGKVAKPPTAKLDVLTDLTDAQIDAPGSGSGGGAEVYLINPGETATPTGSHWLSTSGLPLYFFAVPWGVSDDDSSNKPVYMIVDNQFDYCGTAGSG